MQHLQLNLFGQFHCALDGAVLRAFESDKVRALLLLLAVEQAQAPLRGSLATLLWPDYGEENARANLRQALYQLRQVLGDERAETPFLLTSRQTIQWNPLASSSVDVVTFRRLLAESARHAHLRLEACEECLQRLQQAAELYLGDFLAGFAIAESEGFEEWRRIQQEQLHVQAIDLFHQLIMTFEERRDYHTAQRFAQRLLQLEPWREEAHRQLMRMYARQGQRAAALTQYQSCRQALQQEFGIEPEAATVQLYKEILKDKFAGDLNISEVPATESAVPVAIPHHLPAQSTPFIGREQELTELLALLAQSQHRLLTLLGPGGIGKTRLAIEAAQRLLAGTSRYADGLFFMSLSPLADADSVLPTIATVLDFPLHGADPRQALLKYLQAKDLLLILDNFEHLLAATTLVAEILQSAPRVQIITTSRARLNLHSEYCYPIKPLTIPESTNLNEVVHTAAVRFFVESTKRSYRGFTVDASNLSPLLRICQLVEGMPLGLEMAAAWSEWLPIHEIASKLEESSDFLAVDWLDAPPRQRSMRAVFEWSWKLLDAQGQQSFRALCIFQGGFGRQAAERIAGASLRTLINLTNKSLLHVTHQSDSTVRYQIHELLRQFAEEELKAAGELEEIANRHGSYFLTLIASYENELRSQSDLEIVEIRREIDNIEKAWRWGIAQKQWPLLAQSLNALAHFYMIVGRTAQAVQLFGMTAQALQESFPSTLVEPSFVPTSAPEKQAQSLLSYLLAVQAEALLMLGQYQAGKEAAQRAVALGRSSGNVRAETLGCFLIAKLLGIQNFYAAAEERLIDLLQLLQPYKADKNSYDSLIETELSTILWLGHLAMVKDEFQLAQRHFSAGLHAAQNTKRRRASVSFLLNLAELEMYALGDYIHSAQHFSAALQISTALGYRWGEASALLEYGELLRFQCEYGKALEHYQRALSIFETIHHPMKAIYAQVITGHVYSYWGDQPRAEAILVPAAQTIATVTDDSLKAFVLLLLAAHEHQWNRPQQALVYISQGLQLMGEASHTTLRLGYLTLQGHCQRVLQFEDAALLSYQATIALRTKIGFAAPIAEAYTGVARLAIERGNHTGARAAIDEVLQILETFPRAGYSDPFFIYGACYQMLSALGDPRAANLLQQGLTLLQCCAAQIGDATLRQTFLEQTSRRCQLCSGHFPDESTPIA